MSNRPDTRWVSRLQVGDQVEICDRCRAIYQDTVAKITPTGRIVLVNGDVFYPTGWVRTSQGSCYNDRFIRSPGEPDGDGR